MADGNAWSEVLPRNQFSNEKSAIDPRSEKILELLESWGFKDKMNRIPPDEYIFGQQWNALRPRTDQGTDTEYGPDPQMEGWEAPTTEQELEMIRKQMTLPRMR